MRSLSTIYVPDGDHPLMPGLQHGKRPRGPRVARSTASERAWQTEVMRLARLAGWKVWHFHDSRRQVVDTATGQRSIIGDGDAKGFPDLVLAHPRWGLAFVEAKTDQTSSKATDDQIEALEALAAAMAAVVLGDTAAPGGRIVVHLWRPRDLATVVMPVLQGRRDVPRVYGWSA